MFCLLLCVTAFAQPSGYVPGTQVCWTFNGREHAYFKAAGNGERHILLSFTGDGQFGCYPTTTTIEVPQKLLEDNGINWDGRTVRGPGDTIVWEVLTIPRPAWNFADIVNDVNTFFGSITPIDTSEHWRFHTVGFSGGVGRQWDFLSNHWELESPYSNIFSTTISQSGAWVGRTKIYEYSAGRRHWVWYGAADTYWGTPPAASVALYDSLRGPKHLTGQAGTGHDSLTWDSCMSIRGTDTTTNRWLWMVSRDAPEIDTCDPGGGPAGYVPGTQVNWRFNNRDHGYFRSALCGERHVLIVFQGDSSYDSTNYQIESPQKLLNDLGYNWDGRTVTPDNRNISWEVFAIPYNSGYWLPNYAADINHYFANLAGMDTSDHSKFHIAGISGGVGRMWGFLTNDQSHNSAYRSIFSTTISVAGSWFTDYTPITNYSAGRRHYVWHGEDDMSPTNPPITSQYLYDALAGEKHLYFQPGAGHNYVTVDSAFSLAGADSSNNRWIWMVEETGSLLRAGDELAAKPFLITAPKLVNVFPNPVSNTLNVDLRILPADSYRITIVDISGSILREVRNVKKGLYQVDVSGLRKGLYILQIESGGTREQRKFIKE